MPSVMFSIMNQILLIKLHIKVSSWIQSESLETQKYSINSLMKFFWIYLIDLSTFFFYRYRGFH